MTTNSETFRGYAAKCLQVADQADIQERTRLLLVAGGWIKLADAADAENAKRTKAQGRKLARPASGLHFIGAAAAPAARRARDRSA